VREWRRAPAILAVAFFASVLLTSRTMNDLMMPRWRLDARQRAAYTRMGRIPGDVPVSANERLVPHLATRPQIFIYPTGVGISDFVLDIAPTPRPQPAAGYR